MRLFLASFGRLGVWPRQTSFDGPEAGRAQATLGIRRFRTDLGLLVSDLYCKR